MKRWILMLVGVIAIALVAAGCSGGSGSDSMPGMSGMDEKEGSTTQTTEGSDTASRADFNDADVVFAQGMIPHHQQALEMAALAEDQAASAEVKDLAAQISSAQDPEIEQMTRWLEDWGQPTEMEGMDMEAMDGMESMEMDGMLTDAQMTDLEAAKGTEFDALFLELMIEHHEGAIKMAKTEIADGSNTDAVELAQAIVDAQQAEIDTMRSLLDGQ